LPECTVGYKLIFVCVFNTFFICEKYYRITDAFKSINQNYFSDLFFNQVQIYFFMLIHFFYYYYYEETGQNYILL